MVLDKQFERCYTKSINLMVKELEMKRFITIQELTYLLKYRKVDCNSPFHGELQEDNITNFNPKHAILFTFTSNYIPSDYSNLICIHFKSNFTPDGIGKARYTKTSIWGDYDDCGGYIDEMYPEGYIYTYTLNDIDSISINDKIDILKDAIWTMYKDEIISDTIEEWMIDEDVEMVSGIGKKDVIKALNYIIKEL